jgi:hypothetical protein
MVTPGQGLTKVSRPACAGSRRGSAKGHELLSFTAEEVACLELGDRSPGDNLEAGFRQGFRFFTREDGRPY